LWGIGPRWSYGVTRQREANKSQFLTTPSTSSVTSAPRTILLERHRHVMPIRSFNATHSALRQIGETTMSVIHIGPEQFAHMAERLGIPEAELLANWERGSAEQREEERRYKNLQAAARRRGFTLHRFTSEDDDDEREYGLLSIRWGGEPLMFEDLDEVRDELNSRPVEK
jgi:hypothetical protein